MTSIIGLIISIIGCFLMGNASILKVSQMFIALILTLLGGGLTIYSLVKHDYKKICIVISFILCAISLIMYALLQQSMR